MSLQSRNSQTAVHGLLLQLLLSSLLSVSCSFGLFPSSNSSKQPSVAFHYA